jgi:hypothetical protein
MATAVATATVIMTETDGAAGLSAPRIAMMRPLKSSEEQMVRPEIGLLLLPTRPAM